MTAVEIDPSLDGSKRPRVMFRAKDLANCDSIYYTERTNGVWLQYDRFVDWQWTDLGGMLLTNVSKQATHTLRVSYNDEEVTAWLDGQWVFTKREPTAFEPRSVGFEANFASSGNLGADVFRAFFDFYLHMSVSLSSFPQMRSILSLRSSRS
jgi:hypothetical protein